MKEEIQRTFDDYLQRLKQDESICENFKKLVLEQLGLGTELDPILFRFLDIAKEQNYAYAASGLCHAVLCNLLQGHRPGDFL